MKNIRKDMPVLVGLLATASLAVVSGGLINPATMSILGGVTTAGGNIGANLAASFLTGFTPAKIKKWFITEHPDKLNHSIKKLFIQSISEALTNVDILFSETNNAGSEKKTAGLLIKTIKKHLPDMLSNEKLIQLEEGEIKHFLYEEDKGNAICNFIENQFVGYGVTDPFKSFLAQNLPGQIQLCFGEGLKNPANRNAWIAFQRMLMEEVRSDIKQIADVQLSIKDDLSDLKFEKSGLSEEQVDEIRQLVKVLNDKKLVEVKIKDGINQSLQSIEDKTNKIIQITTETQLTVAQLKVIIEKIDRQNKVNQIIVFALAVCLLAAGFFVAYKLTNQPFTTTIQLYGWEGAQHNPLDGKGTLVLTLGDKTEKAEINRQGEAIFKGILPEYNEKTVSAYITDTDGEFYYLTDSVIQIQKNGITKTQVLLRGLEKLEGVVYDNISGEGLPDVSVTVAGITATTDEKGHFMIEIPIEKQRREQEIEFSKENYQSKRQTIPMSGENKNRTVLERK
ncbi:MAG: carboxypeptidase-like regulatory domain-containing protein [Bacteroidales bacterium]|nr:carboxypeptidase-like regulatory domain-containing protein [Bacteroidales bacterium]